MATESTGGEEAQPAMTHTDKTQLAITSVREKKMDMAFLGKELFAGEGKKGNGASAPLAEEMVATSADLLPKASKGSAPLYPKYCVQVPSQHCRL